MKEKAYGLDFGTSNSAIAITNDKGQTEVLPIGKERSKTIKSVIFFPYVPEKQRLHFVGDEALSSYLTADKKGKFIQSIKSILPDEYFSKTIVQGDYLGADDLIAFILKYIKEKADKLIGFDVKNVVLGRPAKFSEKKSAEEIAQQRLFTAAKKAGFEKIEFQLEPIAAALRYELSITKAKTVLVADLGGGTSDFSVMKLAPGKIKSRERKGDVLATNGICIGGDSFDSDIMWNRLVTYFGYNSNFKSDDKLLPFPIHILHKICEWEKISLLKTRDIRNTLTKIHNTSNNPTAVASLQSLINDDLGFAIFQKIEEAKIGLSSELKTELAFQDKHVNFSEVLFREEFNDYIDEKVAKISATVDETIKLAGLRVEEVDTIFLTGGTSLTPIIRLLIEKKFGNEKITSLDSFTSVATGLALSADLLFE